jgi:hypothetical protein
MSQNILDTRPNPILHEALKTLRNQRNELTLGPPIIFRSLKKLCNGLERFPQCSKPLDKSSQLLGQILNSLHSLHKIPISTKPNQLGMSKLLFGMSLYLLSPIMTRPNRYLHIFNINQERLLIFSKG